MAKLLTIKGYYRYPTMWEDPEPANNRIFIESYAYDFTTLTPRFGEQWCFWNRNGQIQYSSHADFDPWGPFSMSNGMDGTTWSDGQNSIWHQVGIFNLWQLSLDYENYRARRIWKTYNGNIMVCYPGQGTTSDQYGYWWMGRDMTRRAQSHQQNYSAYYVQCWEYVGLETNTTNTWTLVTAPNNIRMTINNHGYNVGDIINVSGATVSGQFAPNGQFVVTNVISGNQFEYQSGAIPVGVPHPTTTNITITATLARSIGIEMERDGTWPSVGGRINMLLRYDWTWDDNSGAADRRSRPDMVSLRWGSYPFFMGANYTTATFLCVETGTGAQGGNNAYSVRSYNLGYGTGTEFTLASNLVPNFGTNQGWQTVTAFPSNIRTNSWNERRIIYSGHFNTTTTVLNYAPLKIEWNKQAQTITTSTVEIAYPLGTTCTNFFMYTTSTNQNTNGYGNYWIKPHQFNYGNFWYVTMPVFDASWFYTNNNLRWFHPKQRTWMTYKYSTATDTLWEFHSAFLFPTLGEFPVGWVPFPANQAKLGVFSQNGTSIFKFNDTSFAADSWSYQISQSVTYITVNKTSHGLKAGQNITVTGATASTNAPNGVFKINQIVNANQFNFIVDNFNSGSNITGSPGGTMLITLGWQNSFASTARCRGYTIDRLGRLWITVRTGYLARIEVHLISESVPTIVSVKLANPVSGTETKYIWAGTEIGTNLLVDTLDADGNRVASDVTLTIQGTGMIFTDGSTVRVIATSASATTQVPIKIIGSGQTNVLAQVTI